MALRFRLSRSALPLLVSAAAFGTLAGAPAPAQKSVEGRVDRLEKEMQAVQRKVFPNASGQIVAPDLQPVAPPPQQTGTPATPPLDDLMARVSAMESQQTRLTGQIEEDGFRIRQLEEADKRLTAENADLRKQIAALTAPAPAAMGDGASTIPSPATPAAPGRAAAPQSTKPSATPAARPDAGATARSPAFAAITKPDTGNAALDGYTYGYRLWAGKFLPDAQAQLQAVLDKYPNDPVASRTGNLLGRAYLDDDKPTQAAKILFDNYRDRPKGDRAAESLAWVGEALIRLKRFKDACLAYEELGDAFSGTMPASVRDMMAKGRKTAKCSG